MSHNQSPVKMVVTDELYEILLHRRAQDNERLAAEGLPPRTDELWCISQSDAAGLAADQAKRSASQNTAASVAPPPPTRGPLCRAAKAKVAERNAATPGFDRHSRKCQICRSPYVDLIEQVYLQWERVDNICRYFQLADTDTLYRHARAAGLDALRRQNSRWVVEQFIEQWRDVKISSATVIRSIRALSCLDDKGRWTDLPKTHIFLRGEDAAARVPDSQPASAESSVPSFERSLQREPHHGRDSGLPVESVTPSPDLPEMESAQVSMPSTERSEPYKKSSANSLASRRASSAQKQDVSFSFERSEPYPGRGSVRSSHPREGVHFSTEQREPSFSERSSQLQDDDVSLSSGRRSRRDNMCFSTERSEPYPGCGSARSSHPRDDVPSSSQHSSRAQANVFSPTERSEPFAATAASDTGVPQASRDDVSFSFERSEPQHGRVSGLPVESATSSDIPEMEPAVVLTPSTERSEPHKNPSANSLATSHSSLATRGEADS